MKRLVALLLSITMLLTGCGQVQPQTTVTGESSVTAEPAESVEFTTELVVSDEAVPQYDSLDDENLLAYVEDLVYRDAVTLLNSDEYFVENVSAVYISKEYLEEVAFNSQSNIYFGYTLAELDEVFQDTKYIFTLSDDGTTTVQEIQEIEDVSTETMLKNVAIGTGVILICVTVSAVSAVGAPAVSMIFAASATTAETFAISGAAFGGISAGVVKGIETGDFNEAVEAAAMGATEGFKWGAISGAVVGGVSEGTALYGAAKQTSFTMNQYAQIQQETGYPLDVIKQFHTMEEYQAFRDANLKSTFVNNRSALIKTDIDLTRVDAKGRTNLERMQQGLAPQDSNGVSYELHHVGQKKDGTLAILSQTEHDNPAIHGFLEKTEAHAAGTNWDAERQAFWKAFAKIVG